MASAPERIGRRDMAIAGVLSLLGLFLMWDNVARLTDDKPPTADEQAAIEYGGILPAELALPLFLLVTVPLLWRRVSPLAATGAAFAGLALNMVLIGTDLLRCGVVLPTALFFAFTAGSQLKGRDANLAAAMAIGMVVLDFGVTFGAGMAAFSAVVVLAIHAIGRVVHSRRDLADELTERTTELRDARDARARLEVTTERTRVSHELDELLHRRLGELARLADRGAETADGATATTTLVDIERESRRTLEEMRAIVGVLRHDEEAPVDPQPALTHLDALLVRAKGADARLTVDGNPRVLPAAVELSAFRIVEQLLAALEDAPDVQVRVGFGDDALELAVSGPARKRGKAAIDRARERARSQAGTFEATVRAGRAEAHASLPLVSVA